MTTKNDDRKLGLAQIAPAMGLAVGIPVSNAVRSWAIPKYGPDDAFWIGLLAAAVAGGVGACVFGGIAVLIERAWKRGRAKSEDEP
jgi:hypothetical protein